MLLFNQNNKFKQTKLWTVGVANLRFYLDLERVMFCKIENGFFTCLFSLRIFEDSKTRKCCFLYKTTCLSRQFWKVSVVTLKFYVRWQRQMLPRTENGFFWLLFFDCKYNCNVVTYRICIFWIFWIF